MTPAGLAAAARGLVGSRFRLHGRDPATGLDCIGVLAVAMARAGCVVELPRDYALRNRTLPDLRALATRAGFVPASGPCRAGDVLMLRVSSCQFHLAISVEREAFVHAHAGLRQVVISPGPFAWPIVQHWRLAQQD